MWLISLVTFIVGFSLSLLIQRDFNAALQMGFIAIPTGFSGLIALNFQRRMNEEAMITALERQIRQMERRKIHLSLSLQAIAAEYDRTESYLDYRQKQLNQLYLQNAEQQNYRQQVTLELIGLEGRRRKLELDICHLEQQKEELDLSVRSLKTKKYQGETRLTALQLELQHIREEIADQQCQKEQMYESLNFLRTKINQWQNQISEIQIPNKPAQPFIDIESQKILTGDGEHPSEELDKEWSDFVAQLPFPELQVLKAIIQQDNPNETIKNIAESHITMPEILIASINERAIATIGDIIIESGSVYPVISEDEYLTHLKKMLDFQDIN